MKNRIYPCLWFNNQAKEAAKMYCSLFKNSEIIAENQTLVSFKLDGKKILALNGGPMFSITPAISLFVYCESLETTNGIWNKLFENGKA